MSRWSLGPMLEPVHPSKRPLETQVKNQHGEVYHPLVGFPIVNLYYVFGKSVFIPPSRSCGDTTPPIEFAQYILSCHTGWKHNY